MACRDDFIGWDHAAREANIHKVVNNVPFLILPRVRITHLASRLLAAKMRILAEDWRDYYRQRVSLLETFIEKDRFAGTCYKGANWQYTGLNRGRGRYDSRSLRSKPVKAIYEEILHRLRCSNGVITWVAASHRIGKSDGQLLKGPWA